MKKLKVEAQSFFEHESLEFNEYKTLRSEAEESAYEGAEDPCQGEGDGDGEEEGGPVAEVVLLDGAEDELDVDEVCLERQGTDEGEGTVHPLWRTAEDAVEDEYRRHGEWDVEHSLGEEREASVYLLLKPDAGAEGHGEGKEYHPYRLTVEGFLLPH